MIERIWQRRYFLYRLVNFHPSLYKDLEKDDNFGHKIIALNLWQRHPKLKQEISYVSTAN